MVSIYTDHLIIFNVPHHDAVFGQLIFRTVCLIRNNAPDYFVELLPILKERLLTVHQFRVVMQRFQGDGPMQLSGAALC